MWWVTLIHSKTMSHSKTGMILLLAWIGTCTWATATHGSVGSSFLLVTLDTTRADHLGPYGAAKTDTPTLSALAADGVVFERAYATTPVTLPSHTSLLTGLDPTEHGVHNNGRHYVADSTTTLAEILRSRGFKTAAFLSAAVLDQRYGLAQGFTVYDDDLNRGKAKELRMIAERPAEVTVSAALDWLDQVQVTDRFFLWLHLFDPHIPYEPPAPYEERFRDRPYAGEIAYMDAQIGRLLQHPRLHRDQTVVAAIADHGESLGEHGEATHAMLAYDSTLHIPWILRWPRGPQGKRLTHAVSQVDLLPTVVELLGLELPSELSLTGLSQVAAMHDLSSSASSSAPQRVLYGESLVAFYTYGWAQLRVAREGHWKLIRAPTPELYNLARDPGETSNLLKQKNVRAADVKRAADLERQLTALIGDETEAEVLPLDRQAEAQLRSLGYLGSRGTGKRRERPDPKDVIDLHRAIEKAEALLSRRDFAAAIDELRVVLRRDPENLTAISGLARAYSETARGEEAINALRRALQLAPKDSGLHLTMATLLGKRGQLEQALAEAEVALALEPHSVDARIEKARYLAQLGRRPEVAALLEAALVADADHPRLNVHYAELVELPAGEMRQAEQRLRRAVRQEPFLATGWRVLGETLEAAERAEDARTAYRSGLEFQSADPTLHEGLGLLLLRLGELDGAESHLRRVVDLLHGQARGVVYDGLASVLVRRGDWRAAEIEARKAVKLAPDLASGWNNLAITEEEQGRAEDAWTSYERAVAADAKLWQARYNQGLLARKIRRFADAAEAFEKVLIQMPEHAGSHYELGLLCAGPLGDPARARRHLEASLRADPEHPRVAQIRQVLARL